MADRLRSKMSCFCLFLLIFLVPNGETAVVMQQTDGCDNIEGTWAFKPNEKANISAYFRVKKSEEYFHFETTDIPERLPFKFEIMKSSDAHLKKLGVHPENFIESVQNSNSNSADECSLLFMDGSLFMKKAQINHVHVIYMNHLDVGYNTNQNYPGTNQRIPGYILNVLNWYFQVYFPRAVRLGNELRDIKAEETFIYTTHPWLVSLYLDCPKLKLSGVELQCPSEEQVVNFRRAVFMGDINWHAGPLNQEPEASNPELFEYSLTLSQKLDAMFGMKKTARTLSQRDIPGMTHAAIPYLVKNGIVAASFGINPSSATPDVPSPNVWKFGNYSIISYWNKGGYPVNPGPDPQHPGGLSRDNCQMAKGTDHALCFAFRTDNIGPPENVMKIKNYFKILRFEFPGAAIKASTFEKFTEQLLPLRDSLPVVTKEVGDTWIQGPASDPIKMSHYRTINRLRSRCLQTHQCDIKDKRVQEMSRMLLKLPEHTYGISSAFDQKRWSNEDFQPFQYLFIGYKNDSTTWLSHRAFNDLAIAALKDHPLAASVKAELKNLEPYLPDVSNMDWHEPNEVITCDNGMKLKIGRTGALTQLTYKGQDWADDQNPLSLIMYRTYNQTDFKRDYALYHYYGEVGINKPNMDYVKAESKFWNVEAHGIYVTKDSDPCSKPIYVRVLQSDMQTWFKYGAPVSYFLKYEISEGAVDIDYIFYNKPSTRLPEALFINFQPKPQAGHQWYLHKLGYLVDPFDVVNNGSQYVHGIDEGVAYFDKSLKGMVVQSFDVGTVCVGTEDHEPAPFPTPLTPMKNPPKSMAFNPFNNIWETNFIYWYPYQPQDKHYKARFRITFKG